MDGTRHIARRERMPMMKVFLPFLAGILVAEHFDLPLPFVAGVTAVCALAALLLRSSLYLLAMAAGCGIAPTTHRAMAMLNVQCKQPKE